MKLNYKEYFIKSKFMNTRDFVFYRAVNLLNKRPVRILEIGTMRSAPPHHHERFSDGWSTMWWCDYVDQYGGEVISVDIVDDHIKTAKEITNQYGDIYFITGDGEQVLKLDNKFDLVYLDGSDCPHQMARQFDLCSKDAIILCDDFHIKGKELNKRNIPHKKFIHSKSKHEMCLFYNGCETEDITIPEDHLIEQKYQEYYYVDTYGNYEGLLDKHKDWYK